ncbi:MAG: 8-oxoguanine DNA glycosylase [Candidatus Nanohaloarchaeota archaeon QJJ-5]|nr:8-oxoguanine DNA glycosylase [Candidatus Nanohaloarchaeota archaeon QJJ-5]
MRTGSYAIPQEEFDLATTLQAGQTFLWFTEDEGTLYDGDSHQRYYTTQDDDVLILWQDGDTIKYKATGGLEKTLEDRFRLHESLESIHERLQGHDSMLDEALASYRGLRLVNDPFVPTLISYLCSVQMRIPRIKKLVNTLAREYGDPVTVDGTEYLQFPSLEALAGADESELRDLGVGYRAKYIARTTDQLTDVDIDPASLQTKPYEDAHRTVKQFYGVGDKVADCVLLFGLGYTEAFPIDTWIRSAVEDHYPSYHADKYHGIADNFREVFGDDLGYAQQYLFHHMRQSEA